MKTPQKYTNLKNCSVRATFRMNGSESSEECLIINIRKGVAYD